MRCPFGSRLAHAGSQPGLAKPEKTGGLMQTALLCLLCWIMANLIIVAVWTVCCVWPRKREAPNLMLGGFRRAL